MIKTTNKTALPTLFLRRLAAFVLKQEGHSIARNQTIQVHFSNGKTAEARREKVPARVVQINCAPIKYKSAATTKAFSVKIGPADNGDTFHFDRLYPVVVNLALAACKNPPTGDLAAYRLPIGKAFTDCGDALIEQWRKGCEDAKPRDKRSPRLAKAQRALSAWETRLKRARNKVKKYEKIVKRLSKPTTPTDGD